MRGKAPINRHQAEEHGVTPACAGKSAGTGSRSGASWDHPRVCGEKADWTNSDVVEWGSPPRVRGKAGRQLGIGGLVGITPAYAGKRLSLFGKTYPEQDHPRVCGEKTSVQVMVEQPKGSPPHMRGKVQQPQQRGSAPGITPRVRGKGGERRSLP